MKISELINGLDCEFFGNKNTEIFGLAFNDKNVSKGFAYFCLTGTKNDGHLFVKNAICNGANAIFTQKRLNMCKNEIVVSNTRKALSLVSSKFYNDSHKHLKLIAVTGTNGKTTITYILKNILETSGKNVAIIGTNGVIINESTYASGMTTPDPIFLHQMFNKMVGEGVEICVMEASAHALDLYKLYGLHFEVSVFTNLTQDHLDYFGTMKNYGEAKLKLFADDVTNIAVLCADDRFSDEIIALRKGVSLTYSKKNKCDAYCVKKVYGNGNMCLSLRVLGQNIQIKTSLLGEYNIQNILAGVLTAKMLNISEESICKGLVDVCVPGRFNVCWLPCGALVVIDYAHTPDAMENVLIECKKLAAGRLITVFGCGGDRDRSKRKVMGDVASRLSDLVYITSDNPRHENPLDIINDICVGLCADAEYVREVDREKAIKTALRCSKRGDVVAILGKGNENYIDIMGEKLPYSDIEVVKEFLE